MRAPIPQKQEVLIDGPDEIAFNFRGRRRAVRSVFDKFRDFEAETSELISLQLFFYMQENQNYTLYSVIDKVVSKVLVSVKIVFPRILI